MYIYVRVPDEARRGCQISRSWNSSLRALWFGCWEPNPDPLKGQPPVQPLSLLSSSHLMCFRFHCCCCYSLNSNGNINFSYLDMNILSFETWSLAVLITGHLPLPPEYFRHKLVKRIVKWQEGRKRTLDLSPVMCSCLWVVRSGLYSWRGDV